jgi:opacity protein-like surface antigen
MSRILLVAAVAALVVPSAARAQAAQPAAAAPAQRSSGIQPGTYDLELTYGGGTMPGTLVVTVVGDSTEAKLLVGDHAPPIKSVTRKGSQLTLSGAGDGVDVRYDLQFSGDSLIGKFTFNGEPGAVTGKRRK